MMNAQDEKRSEKNSRKLDAEERTLWEQITRSVRPLARRRAILSAAPGSAIQPRVHSWPVAQNAVSKPAPPPRSQPRVEQLDRRHKQRLARGIESIDARIDLHGKTQPQAYAALLRFLRNAQISGVRFALVITGKGSGRGHDRVERGVLNRQVPLWLTLPQFRTHVIAFEQAHGRHGGEGALYVRLRRQLPGS